MKKVLLMLVACIAAVNVSAQDVTGLMGWEKSFTPVADKDNLAGVHTAIASDGSIYVSSTYDQAIDFAGLSLAAPEENLLSSIIFKTNKDGVGQWAVTFFGACTINAMTTDTDGTLYVAGKVTDEKVVLTSTDNTQKEIVNPTAYDLMADAEVVSGYSAFVAMISKEGVCQSVKVVSPAKASPDDLMNFDVAAITPTKIVVDGDKVYVSCAFTGNVADLAWEGSYLSMDGWMAQDLKSYGLFSLAKADLSSLTGVAKLQRNPLVATYIEGAQEDVQNTPDAFNFGVYNGTPVMMFIGWGDLKLTTGNTSKDFSFAVANDGTGMNEHAMVCVNGSADLSMIFHAEKHEKSYVPYNLIGGDFVDGYSYFGGTFYGNFPLDNTVTKDKNTSFVASIKMSDCSVNWAVANEVESEAKCMVVTGEEIHASTADALYVFKTANGELKATDTQHGYEDADAYKDECVSTVYTKDNAVWINVPYMNPSGINETKALKNGAAKYYNLNGVELSAPQKGLNIIKTTDGVKKVTVK